MQLKTSQSRDWKLLLCDYTACFYFQTSIDALCCDVDRCYLKFECFHNFFLSLSLPRCYSFIFFHTPRALFVMQIKRKRWEFVDVFCEKFPSYKRILCEILPSCLLPESILINPTCCMEICGVYAKPRALFDEEKNFDGKSFFHDVGLYFWEKKLGWFQIFFCKSWVVY